MAAVAGTESQAAAGQERGGRPRGGRLRGGRRRRQAGTRDGFTPWRWLILILAAVYFLMPLYAAIRFAGFGSFGAVIHQSGFTSALGLSVRLAVITTVITLVLVLPTAVYVHLRLPGLRRLLEGITILPIVIPPVVLIVGLLQVAPGFLKSTPYLLALVYVVLAMPFAYRAFDAGLRAFDLKTLTEASNSLGAGWPSTLWRVILPNLTTALLSATVLTVALVLGEYTMASLDLYQTFPVWIVVFDQTSGPISVAASLLALLVTWLFLLVITVLGTRQARRTGGGEVALFSVGRRQTGGTS
jgi:putative spermidine/putrescine transport system permease protein